MSSMLKAALWYHKKGFSVIPAKKDKRPLVKWEQFQKVPANEVQIREWWSKWENANIAIITGKKSNITVIDADSEDGKAAVENFLPETIAVPVVKTPKGWHYFFKYVDGVSNGVKVLTDCDIRSEGGYVIAPPSDNGNKKKYAWVEGLGLNEITPPKMPPFLSETIASFCSNTPHIIDSNSSSNTRARVSLYNNHSNITSITNHNNHNNLLSKGRRDNDLFHVANCLIKGGMEKELVHIYLNILAKNCSPPFPEKEIPLKVDSAIKRAHNRDKISMQEVREWVSITKGNFSITDASRDLTIITKEGRQKLRVYLSRLVNDECILERVGRKDGIYRRIEKELNEMDIYNINEKFLDVKYPLELHELFATMPKNIIVIAGTPNVGKTAFMLNVAAMNMNRGMDIRYFTSEMGEYELASRLKLFEPDIPYSFWKNVKFCDHSSDFADKIDPNGLNIIDYLEVPDNFWQVGERLTEIYDRLEDGIAVVALQKKFNQKLGRGAEFSLEKPRLYVSLESNPPEGNIAEIIKCKNHKRPDINPNHMECVFKVIQGVKIRNTISWAHPIPKEVKK